MLPHIQKLPLSLMSQEAEKQAALINFAWCVGLNRQMNHNKKTPSIKNGIIIGLGCGAQLLLFFLKVNFCPHQHLYLEPPIPILLPLKSDHKGCGATSYIKTINFS